MHGSGFFRSLGAVRDKTHFGQSRVCTNITTQSLTKVKGSADPASPLSTRANIRFPSDRPSHQRVGCAPAPYGRCFWYEPLMSCGDREA